MSTDILYLTNMQSIEPYKGNYDNFEKTYEELTKNKIREYEAQQQLREHTQVSQACQGILCHLTAVS